MSFSGTNPNVLDLCRLCLRRDETLLPVFDSTSNEILINKIYVCLAIQITVEDKISQKICGTCLIKVDSFFEFRNSSSESQKVLHNWLLASNNVFKESIPPEHESTEYTQDFSQNKEQNSSGSEQDSSEDSDSDETSSSSDDSSSDESTSSNKEKETHPQQKQTINVLPANDSGPSGLQAQPNGTIIQYQFLESSDNIDIEEGSTMVCVGNEIEVVSDNLNNGLPRINDPLSGNTTNLITIALPETNSGNVCRKNKEPTSVILDNESNNNKLKCQLCKYSAKYQSQLDIHIRRHKKEYNIFCTVCHKGFFYQHEIEMHQALHEDKKKLECKICQKKFVYRHSLVAHAKKHEPPSGNKVNDSFQCDTCGKVFSDKSYLNKHNKIHTGVDKVICDVCGVILSNSVSLRSHRRTHTGERPYKCDTCGRDFNTSKYMAVHMRTHTGVKPFQCQTCGKSFSQQSTLIVHKRYHSGERPYSCNLCKKAFVTKTILKIHQQKHTLPETVK